MGMPGINGGRPIAGGSTLELAVEGPDKVYVVENRKGASSRCCERDSLSLPACTDPR